MACPPAQGLYHPRHEHDACGMGFVVNLGGERSHEIVHKGIEILINLTHRGACGCDPETGDGAGILIQIPHEFFARECAKSGSRCRSRHVRRRHDVSAGGTAAAAAVRRDRRKMRSEEGLTVLGWRDTPLNGDAIGRQARATQPYIEQVFLRASPGGIIAGRVRAQTLRGPAARRGRSGRERDSTSSEFFYVPSLSSRTIVYKGLLLAPQIAEFYKELSDPDTQQRAVPGAPAFFDQYVSHLATGASLSIPVPQRRDQYRARQRQLDERARIGAGVGSVWRRDHKNFPGDSAGRKRYRVAG